MELLAKEIDFHFDSLFVQHFYQFHFAFCLRPNMTLQGNQSRYVTPTYSNNYISTVEDFSNMEA